MKSHFLLAGAAATMLLVTSCDKKDEEAPTITVNTPADESVHAPGGSFHLDIDFTDNEELSEYNIDIHEAGGHSHGKVAAAWDFESTGSLSGTSDEVHMDIDIPTDAELSEYHIEISAVDAEGNQAQTVIAIDVE